MNQNLNHPSDSPPGKRPPLLKILCILSFIVSGLFSLTTLVITLFYQLQRAEIMVFYIPHDLGQTAMLFLPTFLLTLAGSIVIWKMKRWGYYLYLPGALIRILFLIVLWLGDFDFVAGIPLALVQLTMIVLFGLNLKHLVSQKYFTQAA